LESLDIGTCTDADLKDINILEDHKTEPRVLTSHYGQSEEPMSLYFRPIKHDDQLATPNSEKHHEFFERCEAITDNGV